ncbi:MAG: PHP domain-containing protein [Chloroflexi bacterium]|nr:MAG: PHP domain-containing protein [Chloroflexota bacterium]TMG46201.1 MAG: PHP domain-containing protein [Chloroflexota bacterium]
MGSRSGPGDVGPRRARPAAPRRARRSDRPVWALPAPCPDPHTIVLVDALAAAQVLSEIGYLLRQDPDERFRAKAFSAAAWSLALQRPDLVSLQRTENLTSIEGVGEGIARVLSDLIKSGESRYLNRLREQFKQPARVDESDLDFSAYQGDVHSHTGWSDGRATMLEMAEGAQALGYAYLGITDHSPRITVVHGLNAERLVAQSREMAEVQKQMDGLTLLQGIEVDILEDGSLDLPDSVLEILDVVIASPHVKLRQEPGAMTERMLRAVSHPHVDVIGHPTGRRPGSREGASYDFEAVFKEAAKHEVALEIDCDPARMDLSPEMARLAYECGCSFAVDADAHAPAEFAYVPMALWMARRAGIPQDRILNFRPLDELTMAR